MIKVHNIKRPQVAIPQSESTTYLYYDNYNGIQSDNYSSSNRLVRGFVTIYGGCFSMYCNERTKNHYSIILLLMITVMLLISVSFHLRQFHLLPRLQH